MQYRQDVLGGILVPSVVRLQTLDDCLRLWVDAPDFITAFPGIHGPVDKDRELRLSEFVGQRADVEVRNSQFVDEVVERGAEVMETVANNGGESRRHGFEEFEHKQLLAALRVEIGEETVGASFEPDSGFGFEALQVVERSI